MRRSPACRKCRSTGRACDGYSVLPFTRTELPAAGKPATGSRIGASNRWAKLGAYDAHRRRVPRETGAAILSILPVLHTCLYKLDGKKIWSYSLTCFLFLIVFSFSLVILTSPVFLFLQHCRRSILRSGIASFCKPSMLSQP